MDMHYKTKLYSENLAGWFDQMATRLPWSRTEKIGVSAAVVAIALAIIGVVYLGATASEGVNVPRVCLAAGSVSVLAIAFCTLTSLNGYRRYLAWTALYINKLRALLTFGSLEFTPETIGKLKQMKAAFDQLHSIHDFDRERSLWAIGRPKLETYSQVYSAIDLFLLQYDILSRDETDLLKRQANPSADQTRLTREEAWLADRRFTLQAHWYDLRRAFRTKDEVMQKFAKVATFDSIEDLFATYCPQWKQLGLISEELDGKICAIFDRYINLFSKEQEIRTDVELLRHPQVNPNHLLETNWYIARKARWDADCIALEGDCERLRRDFWPVQ